MHGRSISRSIPGTENRLPLRCMSWYRSMGVCLVDYTTLDRVTLQNFQIVGRLPGRRRICVDLSVACDSL